MDDVTTFKTKIGTYDYVVIANNKKNDLGIKYEVNNNIEQTMAMTELKLKDLTNIAAESFLMTNFDNSGANVVLTEVKTEEEAKAAPVTIKIGRAVAKVKVTNNTPEEGTDLENVGNVKLTGYKALNMPKKMFAVQMFTSGALKTPYYFVAQDYANYFNATSFVGFDNISYMVENSTAPTAQYGKASYAHVEATFIPEEGVLDANGENLTPYVEGGDIWCIVDAIGNTIDNRFFSEKPSGQVQNEYPEHSFIRHYKGGKMYYSVLISDDAVQGAPKYDVRRNYYYHIQIGKITKLGYSNPELPNDEPTEPTDPIDTEETYVGVKIEVAEWMYVENPAIDL